MFRSLRARLIVLLLLLVAAAVAAGILMFDLFRQSATAQAGRAFSRNRDAALRPAATPGSALSDQPIYADATRRHRCARLTDGAEVKIPPHLSTEIAYSMKPGDPVTIHGLHAAALPLVAAISITDEATGRTAVDYGPPFPGGGPYRALRHRTPSSPRCKVTCGCPCTGRGAV
jgi:hypothetical protein